MSVKHLRQLWTVLGAVLAFYTLNAWIVSQGGQAIFDVDLIEDRPRVGALVAIPICSALLFTLCRIGTKHAQHIRIQKWHVRLPVVWLENLDTSSPEGRWYQRFFLLVYVIIPAAALAHFVGKVIDAPVRRNDALDMNLSPLEIIPVGEILTKTYWIGGFLNDKRELEGAVSWYPVIEPAILAVFVGAAWISVGLLFWSLFWAPAVPTSVLRS